MDKPRYIQLDKRSGKTRYRYNPPQDAVEAGIVPRTMLSDRKETAYNQAKRYNKTLDAWRDSQEVDYSQDKTVYGLIQLYLNSTDFEMLSKTTKTAYEYQLKQLSITPLRNTPLRKHRYKDLTQPKCQEVYDAMCKRGVPFANRALAVIRKVFSFGTKFGYVERNPWRDMATYAEETRKQVWTEDNVRDYLKNAYSDFNTRSLGLIVQMAYEWAQRVGDMRELTWDNLDLDRGVLELTQSKRRARVKIPISEDLLAILKQQHKDFGWQKYVAPNINSKAQGGFNPYTVYTLSHASRRFMKRIGLPSELRISDLRRTATTEMVEAGVGMAQIMSVTGHANPQSVKPYMKNSLTSSTLACTLRSAHRQVI
jgi:integrase